MGDWELFWAGIGMVGAGLVVVGVLLRQLGKG